MLYQVYMAPFVYKMVSGLYEVCLCVSLTISVSLTYPPIARQLLLSQQEAVSIGSFNQMHGLGSVREAAAFCHHRQDGHLPPDTARPTLTVNDQHRH